MSILLTSKIHYFRAPITTGPSLVSMQSSWKHVKQRSLKQYESDEKIIALVRLGNWAQSYENKNMLCTLDWISYRENQHIQFYIELRCEHIHYVNISDMVEISERVHKMMNQNGFVLKLQQLFQQTQPGEASESGTCGNIGKEGDNQLD